MKAIATILLTLLVLGGCSSGYDSEEECFLEETKKCKLDNCITYIEEMCEYPLNNPKYFSSEYIKELEAEVRQREEEVKEEQRKLREKATKEWERERVCKEMRDIKLKEWKKEVIEWFDSGEEYNSYEETYYVAGICETLKTEPPS